MSILAAILFVLLLAGIALLIFIAIMAIKPKSHSIEYYPKSGFFMAKYGNKYLANVNDRVIEQNEINGDHCGSIKEARELIERHEEQINGAVKIWVKEK